MAQILVVDSDPALAGIIEFHLRRGGHQVVVTRSWPDAVAAVGPGSPQPDVVVIDVELPGMTAFELISELRAVEGLSALGAVVLSSRSRRRDSELGQQLGAAYLTKPIVARDLLRAVAAAAGGAGDVSALAS